MMLPPASRVYLACGVTDMRKGFDGLAALVQTALSLDPYGGALFLFRGRRGDHTSFSIPIAFGRGRVSLAPAARRAAAALPALRTGRP